MCSENCLGRWLWKSGALKNGYAIPWEYQTINTAPDNFIWEKDKTSILIVNPGLYELTMGFYTDKKPTIQLLINGEPVLSAINNNVVHHNNNKLKGKQLGAINITGINCILYILGLSTIDFLLLPEKSRIALSFSGEEGGEGFIGFRKI